MPLSNFVPGTAAALTFTWWAACLVVMPKTLYALGVLTFAWFLAAFVVVAVVTIPYALLMLAASLRGKRVLARYATLLPMLTAAVATFPGTVLFHGARHPYDSRNDIVAQLVSGAVIILVTAIASIWGKGAASPDRASARAVLGAAVIAALFANIVFPGALLWR